MNRQFAIYTRTVVPIEKQTSIFKQKHQLIHNLLKKQKNLLRVVINALTKVKQQKDSKFACFLVTRTAFYFQNVEDFNCCINK